MTKINPRQKQEIIKKKWLIIGLLITMIVAVGGAYFVLNGSASEQAKMAVYLKEKYGQEFVVGQPKADSSGLNVPGLLEAQAYPVSDRLVNFKVTSASGVLTDQYIGALWASKDKNYLEDVLKKAYGDAPIYDLDIYLIGHLRKTANKNTSLEDAIANYKQELYYEVDINLEGSNHSSAAFALLSSLRERGLQKIRINFKDAKTGDYVCKLPVLMTKAIKDEREIEQCINLGREGRFRWLPENNE